MKVLNKIKKIFIGVVIVVFALFALIMTILLLNFNKYGVSEFGDKSLVIIRKEISSEKYKKGDLVIVESVDYNLIQPGDEIFAYNIVGQKANIEVGKVGSKYDKEHAISYENGASFSEEYIIGKATDTIGGIGKYLAIIESKWGFLFIVLVPGFIIFLYELYALIVEIRYGGNDDEKAA